MFTSFCAAVRAERLRMLVHS